MADKEDPGVALNMPDESKQESVEALNVKYILYGHVSYEETTDFKTYKDNPQDEFRIEKILDPFLVQLDALLDAEALPGMLILFYSSGYRQCLNTIAKRVRPEVADLKQKHDELRFAEEAQRRLQTLINAHESLVPRVRVITALNLYEIFKNIEADFGDSLAAWFLGVEEAGVRYDSPKLVEALIRVRMIGTGVPVFRIDQDVLFRQPYGADEGNAKEPSLGLQTKISECVEAYGERQADPRMSSFLFSGSYETTSLTEPGECRDFLAWSRAFATRIFPALVADPDLLKKVAAKDLDWKTYVEGGTVTGGTLDGQTIPSAVNPRLARNFYGLERWRVGADGNPDPEGMLVVNPPEHGVLPRGIGWIGAHPLVSVISGALLCISDGAILDLPPFSNFNRNVMWIDDHLKYSLHRELRHFTTFDVQTGPARLRDAKIDGVMVAKGRPATDGTQYVLGVYLPTLLYGTILDAWITPDPLIKWRPERLSPRHYENWNDIPKTGSSKGLLPEQLKLVLGRGRMLDPLERVEFRRRLRKTALERITEVRRIWRSLRYDNQDSFAAIWALGTVGGYVPDMKGRALGLVRPGISQTQSLAEEIKMSDLNDEVHEDLNMLIDDVVTYIELALNWPRIVQQFRSFEPGTLKTDLSWKP